MSSAIHCGSRHRRTIYVKLLKQNNMVTNMANLLSLPAQAIAIDCPWILQAKSPSALLTDSLRTLGQLSPVLVVRNPQQNGPEFRLVCGSARVKALDQLQQEILAMEIDADEVQCCLLYLDSNSGTASTQPDTALALAAMRFLTPRLEPSRIEALLPQRLGLAAKSRGWKRLLRWSQCFSPEDPFNNHLLEGRLPLELIDELQRMREDERRSLEPFFAAFGWSRSAAVQFCGMLRETALGTESDITTLLKDAGLDRVLRDVLESGLSPKDAAERLLAQTRALRYPTLLRLQKRFNNLVKSLSSGTSWRIDHTQQFETPALQLATQVKNRSDLEKALAELQRMSQLNLWETIWSLAEEETDGGEQ